ncbi:PCDA6 protein, partial [Crotophaga sulcirostris]|nr:PCDA6 protein [Crotophaga sulcirostris]
VLLLQAAWALGGGQVRYSVPEEAKVGTVVGRVAQDLGLEAGEAEALQLRLVSQGRRASVEVSGASGALLVSGRLDREELCGKSAPCTLRLEVLLERPLRVFHVELEVTDINDNAPIFPTTRKNLTLWENSPPRSLFPLEGASDADIGANAQLSYTLSPSEHFSLDLQLSNDRKNVLDLVLMKPLDRETVPVHHLLLTASDGGRTSLTGTMELVILVLDANDNAPQFNQSMYKVQLPENAAEGTVVMRINATDPDEGVNSEVTYTATNFIPLSGKDVVAVDPKTGEIRLTGALDFEEVSVFDFRVEARDTGWPPLSGHCSVELKVLDVNDNAPEVRVTSLSVPVAEDASVGTAVALLSVWDRDSGANGRVRCSVWPASPFGLVSTVPGSYSLVVVAKIRAVDADSGYNAWLRYELWEPRGKGPFRVGLYSGEVSTTRALEESDSPRQRLVIVVRDHGEPSRSATATLSVSLGEGGEVAAAAAGLGSGSSGFDVRAAAGAEDGTVTSATNAWLVVAICAVSGLFVVAVVLCVVWRWAPRAGVLSGHGPATLVCASQVGSWSYSQRQSRSMCVAEGSGKSDLMVFSPNCPPPPAAAAKETPPEPPTLLDT